MVVDFDAYMVSLSRGLPGADIMTFCPACKEEREAMYGAQATVYMQRMTIHGVVMHLNDVHKWGRPRIADWLDTYVERGYDLTFKEKTDG